MKRGAWAKKRQLSMVRSISNSMIDTGLPTLRHSSSESSSTLSAMIWATCVSISLRARGVVWDQAPKASRAAATAASTSAGPLKGTSARTEPWAGSTTDRVRPSRASTKRPAMKFPVCMP